MIVMRLLPRLHSSFRHSLDIIRSLFCSCFRSRRDVSSSRTQAPYTQLKSTHTLPHTELDLISRDSSRLGRSLRRLNQNRVPRGEGRVLVYSLSRSADSLLARAGLKWTQFESSAYLFRSYDLVALDVDFSAARYDYIAAEFRKRTGAVQEALADTGATVTVVNEEAKQFLEDTRPPTRQVLAFDNSPSHVTLEGRLGPYIPRAVCIPDTCYNIVSGSQLCGPEGTCKGMIDGDFIDLYFRDNGEHFTTAHYVGGLWFFDLEHIISGNRLQLPVGATYETWPDGDIISYANAWPENPATQLHFATGHMGFAALRKAYNEGAIRFHRPIIEDDWEKAAHFCKICAKAKSKRQVPKKSKTKPTHIYSHLAFDIAHFTQPSVHGHHYIAVLIDLFSRGIWVFFLKEKSDIYDELERWFRTHLRKDERQLHAVELPILERFNENGISVLRTDGAAEFHSDKMMDLYAEYRVQEKQTSIPHSHSDNAFAECAIHSICEIARAVQIMYNEPGTMQLCTPHLFTGEGLTLHCRGRRHTLFSTKRTRIVRKRRLPARLGMHPASSVVILVQKTPTSRRSFAATSTNPAR